MSIADPLIIIAKYCIPAAIAAGIASIGSNILGMAGFPLLPSVLLNLMLLHLAVSALLGRIPINWLVLPIAFYLAWALAVVLNRAQTDQTIKALGLESKIDVSVAPDVDLLFAKNDYFAAAVRRYLVGGRIFEGSEELQVFGSHDPNDYTKVECNDLKYQKFGRRSGGILKKELGKIVLNDCTFSRAEQAPLSGLVFTRSQYQFPEDWPGHRYASYTIDEKSADGGNKRVGEFVFGSTRVWGAIPILNAGCNSGYAPQKKATTRWCWFEPNYEKYWYAFAGDRKLVTAAESQVDDPDLVTVRALAELLGRATRTAPPQL